MSPDQEKNLNRVQRNARLALEDLFAEREHAIITNLVQLYRGGKLDTTAMIGGIAAIAELRYIQTKQVHETALARQSTEEITK